MIITTQDYTVKQRDPLNWTVSKARKNGTLRVLAYHPSLGHALQWLYDRLLMDSEASVGGIEEFTEAAQVVLSGLLSAVEAAGGHE